MSRGLKIQQLRYAVLVHELGSFQAAANRLHRSQPAISLGIRELEAQLDAPIFEKKRQGKLTAFGRIFLPKFQELVGLHDRLNKEIDDVIQQRAGRIEVATVPSIARRFMPGVLNQFIEEYPDIEIGLHDGPAEFVAEMVRSGQVEFGVSSLWDGVEDFNFRPLMRDQIGIVCHQQHPLAKKNTVQWQDLSRHTLITNGTSRLIKGTAVEHLLNNSRVYLSDMTSILALLETGSCVTTLPQLAFQETSESLRFIPLKKPALYRSIGFITRHGASASTTGASVMAAITHSIAATNRSLAAE